MAIEEILNLEQVDNDLFRTTILASVLGARSWSYGGQVIGQALIAAIRTVIPPFTVHSLAGYFLRPGNPHEPTTFHVQHIRDGRTFSHRQVNAFQSEKQFFSMSVSFHIPDVGIEHQDPMPTVPPPEDCPIFPPLRGYFPDDELCQFDEWEFRLIDHRLTTNNPQQVKQQLWFRHRDPLADNPILHTCALAYISDLTLLTTAGEAHFGQHINGIQVASLDHHMWFTRPFRCDEWLLYDKSSPSAHDGRALAQGKIYNQQGQLVALAMQEGLTRYR